MNTEWAGKKVVVCEDEPSLAIMAQRYLEAHGAEVWVENDGEAGLARIREIMPDAVVLDLMMPRMEGSEVLSIMREDEALKSIFVIVTTTQTHDRPGYDRTMELADRVLIKPYDMHDLLPATS
ncbi:MAG: response regulator [Armatimonadetes bacterium]|nr:response regulator [Armatimonadota bacterium]